ncbi:NAD-dependent epimerase/dehydratase family protein, partial [Corynebacterium nasicanis]
VPHLLVASSVGAYSPDAARSGAAEPPLRDESWATGGVESSHYSVDKAAQEEVLDAFAAAHPDILLTRLRPGLTFQADAGSEIHGYFLGPLVPVRALRAGRPPILPVPKGIRLQAVHADDLARAYVAAILRKVGGAFNICADDVLGPQELADVIDHGRFVELSPALVRAGLLAAHKAGTVPADAGWLDMGLEVPLMDKGGAAAELG